MGFVVCCGYIQSLNEEWVLLYVVVILKTEWVLFLFCYIQSLNKEYIQRMKSGFCCLLWLYPEPEQKVNEEWVFVVCFGYMNEIRVMLLFVLVISRVNSILLFVLVISRA